MWPFKKHTIEKRSNYTDTITNNFESQALEGTSTITTIGAVEAAASAYSRAFVNAEVEASPQIKRALRPSVLANIARSLIRCGESCHLIDVSMGELSLLPISSWDVTGGVRESEWVYWIHLYGPSGTSSSQVVSDAVVVPKWGYSPAAPWQGIGPLAFCSSTSRLASNLETKLGDETSGPTGYILPVPKDSPKKGDDLSGPLDRFRADLKGMRGQVAIVETVSGGWGEGKSGAPRRTSQWNVLDRVRPQSSFLSAVKPG